jgi:hypothetical protein
MRATHFQRAPLITLCALALSGAIRSEAQSTLQRTVKAWLLRAAGRWNTVWTMARTRRFCAAPQIHR